MLKRFIAYYKPHKLLFALDMLASLAVAAIAIVYPMITRTMLNTYIPDGNVRMVVVCGCILLGVYVLRALLNFFIQYYGHIMGVKMQAQMRSDMFNHLEKLPYSFFDNHETGKIMSRLTNDLMDISELAHHGPENLLISSISIIASFIYLCTINWWLTLIVFACVPFLILVTAVLRKKMRSAFMRSRQSIGEINAALESSVTGIRVTKAFNNSEIESQKFETGNKKFVKARTDAYKAMGQFHSGNTFINDVFNVVILIAGGFFLSNNFIQVGDYTAFTIAVGLFIGPVMTLIGFMEQYQNGVTGFERFLEVMDAKPEKDAEDAIEIKKAEGHIQLKNVNYSYNEGEEVLKNVSLDIKKGEKFALVGPSGGGKTTICHLIPHFYDVEDGQIFIDGVDVNRITRSSLRANIGIVQQDVYLFNASIRDNILYGRPDATDEEVIEAAKRAHIHDYVMNMPDGYDTVIGERGVRLSGGQKQRVSIARVFLKDPAILILDEATSALDNTTEIQIQNALDELCKGRTTIVVAHRLSTIKNADEIAVVSDGMIIEQGTHDSLIASGGKYADLYKLQFRNGESVSATVEF
ncbi:MAG: ABC transporter ATP-binding protein [Candidatus Neoclostridium sp.]